ncbi:MFS transporter [Marinobacter sp. SS13-12]|uniref:MFS transporter n=1 Tax=Marinobacter sp. SS13-12 TaxID=3050451 RepID=UPI002555AA01|nr:MFS transporter [Marinobacter sp. SS13-12]MDK8464422.1 MFS transporter [Marinobacter sp. SS13-12]
MNQDNTTHHRVAPKLASLAVLLLATVVMYVSQGLTHTLVPLRLASGSISGFVTACYFLGFGLGAFLGPLLIRRVGHIRAFGGLLGIVIFAVLSLALIDSLWFWGIIRLLHGASIAAVAVVVEAWLVSASGPEARGRVLAVYTLAVYGGIGIGPLFLTFLPDTLWQPFSVAAIALCLAAVPVLFWRTDTPVIPPRAPANWRRMINVSPVSLATATAAGFSGGALTALGPIYAVSLGLDTSNVALMMSVPVILGLILQWPVGMLSDRYERRRVMSSATLVSASFALMLIWGQSLGLAAIYILLAGLHGVLYALYPLALAHANDRVGTPTDTADIGAGLLLGYGIGAAAGPAVAGGVAIAMGPLSGFLVAMVALALTGSYILVDVHRHSRVAIVDKGAYTNLPSSTPEVFELEPRTVPDPVTKTYLTTTRTDESKDPNV